MAWWSWIVFFVLMFLFITNPVIFWIVILFIALGIVGMFVYTALDDRKERVQDQAIEDKTQKALTAYNSAESLVKSKQFADAEPLIQEALTLFSELKNDGVSIKNSQMGIAYHMLAEVKRKDDPKLAEESYQKAISYFSDPDQKGAALYNLSIFYQSQKRYDDAILALKREVDLRNSVMNESVEKVDDDTYSLHKTSLIQTLETLDEIYSLQGNTHSAENVREIALQLKKS